MNKSFLEILNRKNNINLKLNNSTDIKSTEVFIKSIYKSLPEKHQINFYIDESENSTMIESILHRYLRSVGHDNYSIKKTARNKNLVFDFVIEKEMILEINSPKGI